VKPRLYVMAKAPVLGQAKSRLAKDIGKVHAHRIYRAMMNRILREVQDPRWETVLAVTPPRSLGRVPDWDRFPQIAQSGGSLSPRLAMLFEDKGPTMAIGTDCPQIRARDIAAGFAALRSHKAVFGPAEDGGFWLIALNGPVDPRTFDDVRWSNAQTLADMRNKTGKPVKLLRTLTDVDDAASLQAVRADYPGLALSNSSV